MRLFVALDIPDNTRQKIAELVAQLRPACPQARWVRVEGIHITLKFIGEAPPEKLDKIRAALAGIHMAEPVEMTFHGIGFFPNERRPRVFWAGIAASANLAWLAGEVERLLEPLGIPRESRPFKPHLTVARFDAPAGLRALHDEIGKLGPAEFGQSVAREFCLYQSQLKPGGAEYTRLATFRFTEEPQ